MIITKLDQKQSGIAVSDCILFDSGRRMVSLFSDGTLRLYNTNTKKWNEIKTDVKFKCFNVNENGILAAVSELGCLEMYSLQGINESLIFVENLNIAEADYRATSLILNDNSSIMIVAIESNASVSKKNDRDDDDDDDFDRVKILFYDIRQRNFRPLGCYKESHSSEVTCLKFAPICNDYLLSGGSDGLVNVYDLRESTEDDALLQSFNCESSVARCNFYGDSVEHLKLYAVAEDSSLHGWKINEGDEIFSLRNATLNDATFLVDCFVSGEDVFQVCSSVDGNISIGKLNETTKRLQLIESSKVHTDLVRCSSWYDEWQLLATGGDDGAIFLNKVEMKMSPNLKLKRDKKGRQKLY